MKLSIRSISQSLLLIAFAILSASSVFAQAVPDNAPISDQKPGSVLIFNYYGSDATNLANENTRINITNTQLQKAGAVVIFFVDSVSGAVADGYICLGANQTISFLVSDVDPGAKGYIVVVSVDQTGRPNKFNYLTGSEFIKMSSGYSAAVNAETISALVESPTIGANGPLENGVAATLKFDDVRYNKLPGTLVVDHVGSIGDGNRTMVIVNQIGGSLFNGGKPDNLNSLAGTLYDLVTNAYSWQVSNINSCQFRKIIANDFPLTTPNVSTVIPPSWYGWMKFSAEGNNKGVTGMVLYLNSSTVWNGSQFNGGRNLHHLMQTTDELTIPITAPSC